MQEDKWINRTALLSAIMQDVSPFMQDDTLCDRNNPEANSSSVACRALLQSLFKKWQQDGNSVQAESKALLTFLEANRLSETWSFCAQSPDDALLLNQVKRELDDFLHIGPDLLVDSFSAILEEGDVGPGSSVGSRGESFYAKLCASPLTTTSLPLYEMYSAYTSLFPTFADAESVRLANYGSVSIVDGSNVSFAPKNVDTARLICVEPSLNMFMQLGLKSLLERRLRDHWGIDVGDQPELNRLLARLGSLSGDFATLDLKSASDLVSLKLCETLFPSWFYDLLVLLRSPKVHVREYGLSRELGMVSTMGNGFTFPLMTIILAAIVRAVYKIEGIPIKRNSRPKVPCVPRDWIHDDGSTKNDPLFTHPGNWGVFGDDIICVREAYDRLCRSLDLLGFQVNVDKSFNTGPFRESCGHDYFRGTNIRGVYLKRFSSRQDLTVAVNLLNEWTARTGVPLRNSVQYILGFFKPLYVPWTDPLDAGVRVPSSFFSGRVKSQRVYYKAHVKRPKTVKFLDDFTVRTPNGAKRLVYNSSGSLLALLRGELRDGQIATRQNSRGLYHTRWCVTPNWDYMPLSVWVNPRTDWRRFESAVALNMSNLED